MIALQEKYKTEKSHYLREQQQQKCIKNHIYLTNRQQQQLQKNHKIQIYNLNILK